jgi:RND superfamily putative drug exporter
VVCVAVLGSVTVLPALLSLLGDRVDLGRIPGQNRNRAAGRVSGAVLKPVLAAPALFAVLAAGVLVALAIPAFGMHTENLGVDQQLPAGDRLVTAYDRISHAFPGSPNLATVVIRDPMPAQVEDLTSAIRHDREFGPLSVGSARGVTQIQVPLPGSGNDATAQAALSDLRQHVIPSTGVPAYVTGNLASSDDFNTALTDGIVPVFAFVLGVTFVLMLVSFRSLTIACTTIVLNLLSVGAAYGVLVMVFQHQVGAIESWLPMFVFVVLFGLSMDYHVFVVSRIREARDRGLPTRDAITEGVRGTAGAVTSAAVIMVAVFAVFATLSLQDFRQLGVGLAVAILLDATLVRVVLVPALMRLLGNANWYLPRWLDRVLPGRAEREHTEPRPVPLVDVGSRLR